MKPSTITKAQADHTTSRFYLRCPTKNSVRTTSSSCKGYFENLIQFVAIGFDVGIDQTNEMISNNFEDGGIFIYNENESKKINASNKAGRSTTALTRIDAIAYLIELAYDLSISSINNVSRNLGFESCLNIY